MSCCVTVASATVPVVVVASATVPNVVVATAVECLED